MIALDLKTGDAVRFTKVCVNRGSARKTPGNFLVSML